MEIITNTMVYNPPLGPSLLTRLGARASQVGMHAQDSKYEDPTAVRRLGAAGVGVGLLLFGLLVWVVLSSPLVWIAAMAAAIPAVVPVAMIVLGVHLFVHPKVIAETVRRQESE